MGDTDQAWIDALRREHYPPERNRVPAHLTLFHHLPPSVESELRHHLQKMARATSAPTARISGLINLGGGTALRIESRALETMRTELAEHFEGLLTPQDQARWRPHITIQNKVDGLAARTLQKTLACERWDRAIVIKGLSVWRYAEGRWEAVSKTYFK